MCDYFWQRMDDVNNSNNGDQQGSSSGSGGGGGGGDLADIVRSVNASAVGTPSTTATSWQFKPESTAASAFETQLSTDDYGGGGGDPFDMRDPVLLHELTGTSFFDGCGPHKLGSECESGTGSERKQVAGVISSSISMEEEEDIKTLLISSRPRPNNNNNLFSRVLHISPAAAAAATATATATAAAAAAAAGASMIGTADHHGLGLHISSPRTTTTPGPGIKRRKSQAKKVVCIPAAAAASSRPSGEVVPSDLWAWRKYGQKPIKGSPYPRGYYRCSSSKGCSARKQVERSRTNPNMLVITYTSEHNHPWPTQRNALAGSTRSQPSKIGGPLASKIKPPPVMTKVEPNKEPTTSTSSPSSLHPSSVVKEEEMTTTTTTPTMTNTTDHHDHIFDGVYFYNEHPIPELNPSPDDFFADLAELDPDPMSLVFPRSSAAGAGAAAGFIGASGSKSDEEVENKESSGSKGLDAFINMFDWGGITNSFGENNNIQQKKGL